MKRFLLLFNALLIVLLLMFLGIIYYANNKEQLNEVNQPMYTEFAS